MFRRIITTAGLVAGAVLPGRLAAQQSGAPADWIWRLDAPQQRVDGDKLDTNEWRYTPMPPGWHVTTTDQGVFLFPRDRVISGPWGIEVELFLFPRPGDEPFGIVLEGKDAQPGAAQLRFLLRRDGTAGLVARHQGSDTLLVPWVADTGVKAHSGGVDRYVLRVMHQGGFLAFSVNGRDMLAIPTGGEDHPSVPGLRIGRGLNLHVARFDLITPLAPPRRRGG